MCMCHIVICRLSSSTAFFSHYLINGMIFEKKKVTKWTTCILIFFYEFCLKHFLLYEELGNI